TVHDLRVVVGLGARLLTHLKITAEVEVQGLGLYGIERRPARRFDRHRCPRPAVEVHMLEGECHQLLGFRPRYLPVLNQRLGGKLCASWQALAQARLECDVPGVEARITVTLGRETPEQREARVLGDVPEPFRV